MTQVKTLADYVSQAKSQIHEVEVTEVDALLEQGYRVLDVREPNEFAEGAIKGAVNVPRGILEAVADLAFNGRDELEDRDAKWLLFCASSGRSAMASLVLQEMGFHNIKNINGGLMAWRSAEMELVNVS